MPSTRCVPPRHLKALWLLLALLLGACTPARPHQPIQPRSLPLPAGAGLHLDVQHGTVELVFGDFDTLGISGAVRGGYADDLVIDSETTHTLIHFAPERGFLAPHDPTILQLALTVPQSTGVTFETFDANLSLSGEGGVVHVTTTSGDVLLEGFSGEAVVTANRGNVTIQASRGDLSVFANYGFVHFTDAHGRLSVVSILGQVTYTGRPEAGDNFTFQTDHARVEIAVPKDADLEVDLQSSSADVVCAVSGLAGTSRSCRGTLGQGGAVVHVKTVSGPVSFRLDPLLK